MTDDPGRPKVERHPERLLFTISVIFLTGLLGAVTGLLLGFLIFGKAFFAQIPLFAQPTPTALRVVVAPTPVPPTLTATALPPTATLAPPTALPTPTITILPSPIITPTATRVVIRPTATPTLLPGIYVTNFRTDPAPAKQKQDLTFYVTLLNTTGEPQTYHWYVLVYSENQTNAVGQTSADKEYFVPPGASEHAALNTWRVGPGQPCTTYTAKIQFVDQLGGRPNFGKVSGAAAAFPFQVCP